jgi:hypothetical protein
VVTPQKFVNAPDQASTATNQTVVWPYVSSWDHNAGYSSKSATIIKVEPLPAGTTDINVYEAGWNYIDQEKLVIYGALEGPTLISPINGVNSPLSGTILSWKKFTDPDPTATVTYTVEISKDKLTWTSVNTQVTATVKPENTQFAGAGKFMLFGVIGTIALGVPRRTRKYLGVVLLIITTGAVFSSCSNSNHTADAATNPSISVPAAKLIASTKYYWRVTADGPNSHATSEVSEVSTFTTTQ